MDNVDSFSMMTQVQNFSEIKISRVLHAGYLLEHQGYQILFDPLFENPFSKNCYAFPAVEFDQESIRKLNLSAIFISHYHDDHFSLDSLKLLNRETAIYMFSIFEELFSLLHDLGFKNVYPIQILCPIHIGPFEIIPHEALDADVDSIYHIKVAELNILHVVDSWIGPVTFDRLLAVTWDLVLWPFQTMREIEVISPSTALPASEETRLLPAEWVEQIQRLKPKAVVPSSCQFQFENWSWYNKAFFPISYAGFAKQIQAASPQTSIYKLNPGESMLFNFNEIEWQKQGCLPWIKAIENQDIDYIFDPETKPQTTAYIAKQLGSISDEQKSFVHHYCQKGLLIRYASLNDEVFESLSWCLKVYNHEGFIQDYHYRIAGQQIQLTTPSNDSAWTTEISEAKLYAALVEGESLTSIYIRVIPAKHADPLQDPLIRCLYEGVLGAYQKAQLKN